MGGGGGEYGYFCISFTSFVTIGVFLVHIIFIFPDPLLPPPTRIDSPLLFPVISLHDYPRPWAQGRSKTTDWTIKYLESKMATISTPLRDLRRFVELGRKIVAVGRNYRYASSHLELKRKKSRRSKVECFIYFIWQRTCYGAGESCAEKSIDFS